MRIRPSRAGKVVDSKEGGRRRVNVILRFSEVLWVVKCLVKDVSWDAVVTCRESCVEVVEVMGGAVKR